MRNSTVITSVFMALCASNAFAQTYAESYMPWEGNKVQWNDFRATTPMADSLAYKELGSGCIDDRRKNAVIHYHKEALKQLGVELPEKVTV